MSLRIEGRVEVWLDKKGYPRSTLKTWNEDKVVVGHVSIPCYIPEKLNVNLEAKHSYNADIKGYLSVKHIESKDKMKEFDSLYISITEFNLISDYSKESGKVEAEAQDKTEKDELPF